MNEIFQQCNGEGGRTFCPLNSFNYLPNSNSIQNSQVAVFRDSSVNEYVTVVFSKAEKKVPGDADRLENISVFETSIAVGSIHVITPPAIPNSMTSRMESGQPIIVGGVPSTIKNQEGGILQKC